MLFTGIGSRTELEDGGPENDPLVQLMEGGEDDPDTGDASLVGPVGRVRTPRGELFRQIEMLG